MACLWPYGLKIPLTGSPVRSNPAMQTLCRGEGCPGQRNKIVGYIISAVDVVVAGAAILVGSL
jgi:hypothetical protein